MFWYFFVCDSSLWSVTMVEVLSFLSVTTEGVVTFFEAMAMAMGAIGATRTGAGAAIMGGVEVITLAAGMKSLGSLTVVVVC